MPFDKKAYMREYNRRYYAGKQAETKERVLSWQRENKDKHAEHNKRWRTKNLERCNTKDRERQRVYRKTLSDHYVRNKLTRGSISMTSTEWPQSLVEVKRQQLKCVRLSNELRCNMVEE